MKLVFGGFFVFSFGSCVFAQTSFLPLSEIMKRPSDQVEVGYPFVRCAALYNGAIGYGGKTFDEQTLQALQNNFTMNLIAAAIMRMKKANASDFSFGSIQKKSQEAAEESQKITDIYIGRMHANYADNGQALGGDSLIEGDLATCSEFSSRAASVVDSIAQ